jgi:dsDNA-binding SOS-regulon protein
MATTVAISIPQIAELDSQVAAIDERLKTTSDPHLIAELRAQKTEEQERSAAISKKMAIAFVPEIVNQMRDSARKYDEDLYRSYEETNEPTSFPPSPTKTKELAQVLADRSILTSRHQTEMSQMVSIADYLRGQLVQGIPQIDEDKTEAQSFAAAINGDITSFDVRKATTYLEDLVGRNR